MKKSESTKLDKMSEKNSNGKRSFAQSSRVSFNAPRALLVMAVVSSQVLGSVAGAAGVSKKAASPVNAAGNKAIAVKAASVAVDSRITSIRGNLSATSPEIERIELMKTILGEKDFKVPSSYFFKQLLAEPTSQLKRNITMLPPVEIDPNMSTEDVQRRIALRDAEICVRVINKSGYSSAGVSEMDQILTNLMVQHAKPAEAERKTSPAKLSQSELDLRSAIEMHLRKGPTSVVGQIETILGNVHDAEAFGSRLRGIVFTRESNREVRATLVPHDKKITLSLSMLASIRTGQDEAFIRLQKCMVDYLYEQQSLFGSRLSAIEHGDKDFRSSSDIIREASASDGKFGVTGPSRWKSSSDRLKFFFEGHPGFTDTKAEKDFLENRLVKISSVLPFLAERLAGAQYAASTIAKLSKEQQDFLMDFLMKVTEDDTLSPQQVDALLSQATKDPGDTVLSGKLVYYRQLSRDLTALETELRETKEREAASRVDLRALEVMARQR